MTHKFTPKQYNNCDRHRELSFQFYIDGYQFSQQAKAILNSKKLKKNCKYHLGYIYKTRVLLIHSIECSLKCIYCASHATQNPIASYESIKKMGHSIKKLMESMSGTSRSKIKVVEAELKEIENEKITTRYGVEACVEFDLISDFKFDEKKYRIKFRETKKLLETSLALNKISFRLHQSGFDETKARTISPFYVQEELAKVIKQQPSK